MALIIILFTNLNTIFSISIQYLWLYDHERRERLDRFPLSTIYNHHIYIHNQFITNSFSHKQFSIQPILNIILHQCKTLYRVWVLFQGLPFSLQSFFFFNMTSISLYVHITLMFAIKWYWVFPLHTMCKGYSNLGSI